MSLIITYIGRKGCVIAGDKRRIGFYGPEQAREKLEEELYSGQIKYPRMNSLKELLNMV